MLPARGLAGFLGSWMLLLGVDVPALTYDRGDADGPPYLPATVRHAHVATHPRAGPACGRARAAGRPGPSAADPGGVDDRRAAGVAPDRGRRLDHLRRHAYAAGP